MFDSNAWLLIAFLAYGAVCIIVGVVNARRNADALEFFTPAGGIRTWAFVFAATTGLFAGWTITGEPGQMFADGFSFVNASFFVISIPLGSALVLKRQWRLGRKYGYLTPGDLYSGYFGGEAIPLVAVAISLLFAIPFLATLQGACGVIIQIVTDGAISREVGMWTFAAVLLVYGVAGGIGGVAQVGVMQGVLFMGAAIIIGGMAAAWVGGFASLGENLARLASSHVGEGGSTRGFGGGDYNGLFAIPGVIQFTAGLGREAPSGGPWTAIMGLSFVLSLMGLSFAPAFSVLGFASRGPRAFAIHQIWGGAFSVGLVMFIFSPLQGLGALFLGASASANAAKLSIANILPTLSRAQHGDLVANYIRAIPPSDGWLMGLLAVAAVAAMQATAAIYLVTAGNIFSRDVYARYFRSAASWEQRRAMSRIAMLLLSLIALVMATFSMKAALILAALAVPCSFQMAPSLLGALWLPWITRRAATLGLFAGLIVVVATEPLGQWLTGNALPWGRWPWTIHSGVWGIVVNLAVCATVSAFARTDPDRARRDIFHRFLNDRAGAPAAGAALKSAAWILLLAWTFFAVGPGAVLGNSMFGAPNGGYAAWTFGVPSLWAWQVFWWIAGVGLVWFLAMRMGLSDVTPGDRALVAANEAIANKGARNEQ